VNAALASLIAVAGTLLGSLITYRFQRLSTDRAEAFARDERLREERLATYSAFAGAISDLRRAVITLWFRKRDEAEERELAAAWVEADRLGAAATHARFRVQLVAEDADLVALADAAFEPIGAIGAATNRNDPLEHENKCQDALKAFITAAAAHVR
jgi:hypothetical protein